MKSHISGIQIPTDSRINIDGGLTLDSLAGTSGQVLTSAGAGATPTWSTLSTTGYRSTFSSPYTDGYYYTNLVQFVNDTAPSATTQIVLHQYYSPIGSLAFDTFSNTSTIRGYIKIKSLTRFFEVVWQVNSVSQLIDEVIWLNTIVNVTHKGTFGPDSGSAVFANNEPIAIEFYRTGDKGATGTAGATGAAGKTGYAATFSNNLYASDAIYNSNGSNTGNYTAFQINDTIATSAGITLLQSSTSAIKGHLRIRSATGSLDALYAVNSVTYYPPDDSPNSWGISATYVSSTAPSSAFTNGQAILIEFYRTGDAGSAGSVPTATATVVGGIELFDNAVQTTAANAVTTTASRTYGLQLNSSLQGVVNVPWTDTNTFPTTWTWTGGAASGPTASITGTSSTISVAAVPSASASASGIVTTGTQTFAGTKSMTSPAITTSITTPTTTTFSLLTSTIATMNFATNSAILNIGKSTGIVNIAAEVSIPNKGLSVGGGGVGGFLDVVGPVGIDGTMTAGIINASGTVTGANLTTAGTLTRTALVGGGSTTATINNSGEFVRTTSSARYKQDIQDAEFAYGDILALTPKTFRLKDEAEENPDSRLYAGFIAEDVDQIESLKVFVNYLTQEDNTRVPDGIAYGEMVSALVSAIKHQDTLIKSLEARIEALENN